MSWFRVSGGVVARPSLTWLAFCLAPPSTAAPAPAFSAGTEPTRKSSGIRPAVTAAAGAAEAVWSSEADAEAAAAAAEAAAAAAAFAADLRPVPLAPTTMPRLRSSAAGAGAPSLAAGGVQTTIGARSAM